MNKNKFLIAFALVFIVLAPLVSADLNLDNSVIKGEISLTNYPSLTIKNLFGLGDTIWSGDLTAHTDVCGQYCSSEMTIFIKEGKSLIDEIDFYTLQDDGKWLEQDVRSYEISYLFKEDWLKYNLGEKLPEGTYKIQLNASKKPSRTIDWIITTEGKILEDWAIWGNITEGDEAQVTLNSPLDNEVVYDLSPIDFNCSAYITNWSYLTNISLWGDFTGTWELNQTLFNLTQYTEDHFDTAGSGIGGSTSGITTNNTFFWIAGWSTDEVYKYWMNGTYTGDHFDTSGQSGDSNGITTNNTFLWIVDWSDKEVYKYTMAGVYVDSFDTSVQSGGSYGITTNNTFIWVTDLSDDEVIKYTMEGVYVNSFDISAQSGSPRGITTNNTFIWVTDIDNKEVYKYTMAGVYVDSFDTSGQSFNSPGITTNNTFLWTTSNINSEVYKYTMGPVLNYTVFTNPVNDTTLWSCQACDTDGDCGFASENRTIYYQQVETNYDNVTYETATDYYSINLINAANPYSSASLIYDGTVYPSTKTGTTNITFTNEITHDVSSSGDKTFYWIFNYPGGTLNSNTYTQQVRTLQFGQCNASLTVPYINFSFKNEETLALINVTADNMETEYWLGDGSVTKFLYYTNVSRAYHYTFCSNATNNTLHNSMSFPYSSTGYPQRTYKSLTDLTNSSINKTLYLLASGDGIYSTLLLQTIAGQGVTGGVVTVQRQFSGVWTTISQGTSGDDGAVTFWVNPNYPHKFIVNATGYVLKVFTITPSQSVYTIVLESTGGTLAEYSTGFEGIQYGYSPKTYTWLNQNKYQKFTFNITDNQTSLIWYSINLTNSSGFEFNSTFGTDAAGSGLSIYLNPYTNKSITGRFYADVGDGIFELDPVIWTIANWTTGEGSLKSFFNDLRSFETGSAEEHFTMIFFVFFIFFIILSVFTRYTSISMESPGSAMIFVSLFVLLCTIGGIFNVGISEGTTLMGSAINNWGVFIVSLFLLGGYLLGHLSKN